MRIVLTGTSIDVRKELFVHGLKPPIVSYEATIEKAIAKRQGSGERTITDHGIG